MYVFSANNQTLAAAPTVINDRPLEETTSLIKASNISAAQTIAKNQEIELQVKPDDLGITFVALNKGTSVNKLDVDQWTFSIRGERMSPQLEFIKNNNSDIPENGSIEIKRLNFADYGEFFEMFPGTYSVDLIGLKWIDPDPDNGIKGGNIRQYRLQADITIDYDVAIIRASSNKLLKSENMQVAIGGTGNPFEIDDGASRKVDFYVVNNGNTKISSKVKASEFTIWNSEQRFKGDGITGIMENDSTSCRYLEPNEKYLVSSYEFSKENWPIAKDGIAKHLGSQDAVPGTYIAFQEVETDSCTLPDGEEVLGGTYIIFVAFEVKP